MNLRKLSLNLLIPGVLILFSGSAYAQCKTFVKKDCIPDLDPFVHNGQVNTTTLMAGEKAEVQLVFFQGLEYRIMICSQEVLGSVNFRLLDSQRKEVFNSKNHNEAKTWDFKAGTTQNFIIEVETSESSTSHGMVEHGCVSVLIGSRENL